MSEARLQLTFKDSSDSQFQQSYKYIKTNLSSSYVSTLADAIVDNGSVFDHVPVSCVAAKLVVTSEVEYDLSA